MSFADMMKEAQAAGVGFGELVPIGEYEMFVWKAKAGKTSNGKFRLEVTGKIVGGPQDGKTVWNQFVLSPENPNAMGFFFRHMAVLGAGPDWFAPKQISDGTFAELAAHVLGARFRCAVGQAEVNKETRNQFEKVMPSAIAPGQKMEGATAAPGAAGGMIPSVASVPTGVPAPVTVPGAVPQVEQPQASAPAPSNEPAPGALRIENGQQEIWTGISWVPTGQAAETAPAVTPATAPEAPKAPF